MFLSLLFCLSALASDLRLNELEPKLDAFVQQFQPVENTGIALGIVKDGKLVYFKGYGYRDREKKLPVTERTVFAIGSITKTFISTSLALLEERKQVRFDESVKTYLPEFSLENPEISSQATLNDILSHQSGLPRHDILAILSPFTTLELISKLPLLEMNKAEGMGFRSGKMQYNNLMFMVAGQVLRRVTGVSWYEFVRENFLIPLGMKETSFTVDGFAGSDSALAYARDREIPYYQIGGAAAAGSMNASTVDMAKWLAFHLEEGKGFMRPETLARLYEKRSDSSIPAQGIDLGYGLGMMLGLVEGKPVVYHGGNINGFSTHISFMPETGVGLVVLVNQDSASNFQHPFLVKQGGQSIPLLPYIAHEHFLTGKTEVIAPESRSRFDEQLAELHLPGFESTGQRSDSVRLATANPYFFGGNFSELAYGNLSVVTKEDGSLALNYYGNFFDLAPGESPEKFWIGSEKSGMSVEFEVAGNVVSAVKVLFEPAVKPIRFVRN